MRGNAFTFSFIAWYVDPIFRDGNRMAMYERPKINFWESVRGTHPLAIGVKCPLRRKLIAPRNSVACSCSCTRWRSPAAGGARLRLHYTYACRRNARASSRPHMYTHVYMRSQRMDTRLQCTRYRSAFLRGMSTRYRTLIEERKVHNYARRSSSAPRREESLKSFAFPPRVKPLLHGWNWAVHIYYIVAEW